jgi:hypothetical protein
MNDEMNTFFLSNRYTHLTWDWVGFNLSASGKAYDDTFIDETLDHWYFGTDNSGDIRHACNIEGAWQRAKGACFYMFSTLIRLFM